MIRWIQESGGKALSVADRFNAARAGLRDVGVNSIDFVRLFAGVAIVATVAFGSMFLLARMRRARWLRRHVQLLRGAGLQAEEIGLFRRISRRSDAGRLPLLVRNRASFDEAASLHVRHFSPVAGRREELSRVLSLRRRIPFDHKVHEPPAFEPGLPVTLVVRLDSSDIRQIAGCVLGTPAHALQIGLQLGAADVAVAERMRTGQEVMLVLRNGNVLKEARVRIRGRCMGRTLQVLVDRPVALTSSRVRLAWHGADERVLVEMVERFSERLVGDEVPRHDAVITASSSDGLLMRFRNARPRHAEAIRVLAGPYAGFYRGYAVLAVSGKGGEVFVLRRQNERAGDKSAASPEAATPAHGQSA